MIKLRDESDEDPKKQGLSVASWIAISVGGVALTALLIGGLSIIVIMMFRCNKTMKSCSKAWEQYGETLTNPSIVDFKARSGIHNPNYK